MRRGFGGVSVGCEFWRGLAVFLLDWKFVVVWRRGFLGFFRV